MENNDNFESFAPYSITITYDIYSNSKLSKGARIAYGLFEQSILWELDEKATIELFQKGINCTDRTAKRYLRELKNCGLIK